MADEEFVFAADTSDVLAELDKIVDEARDAGRGMARGIGDGAEGARKKTETETKKIRKAYREAFEGSGKIFKAFEGQVGGAFSIVEDFTDGLSEMSAVIGPAGTALAGLGLGVAAMGFVMYSGADAAIALGQAGVEAFERLDKISTIDLRDQRDGARDLTRDMEALTIGVDILTLKMSTADGVVGDFLATLGGVAIEGVDFIEWLAEAHESLQGYTRTLVTILSLGSGTPIFDDLIGSSEELAEVSRELADESRRLQVEKKAEEALDRMVADAKAANEAHARAMAEADREASEAARALAAAQREVEAEVRARISAADKLQSIQERAAAVQLDDMGRIITKWQDLREQVAMLPDDYGLAAEALSEIDRAQGFEIQALYDKRSADFEAHQASVRASMAATTERSTEMLDGMLDWQAEATKIAQQSLLDAGSAVYSQTESILGQIQALGEQRVATLAETDVQAAREAFRRNQNLQEVLAVMDAARATVSLIPAFAFAGPAAPLLAAATVAPALGIQLATIQSQPVPEFPTGLSSDHHLVGIQRGELIASRRAASDPMVREAVDRGNRGERMTAPEPSMGAPGYRLEVDPRLSRVRVVEDKRVGKRPARRR